MPIVLRTCKKYGSYNVIMYYEQINIKISSQLLITLLLANDILCTYPICTFCWIYTAYSNQISKCSFYSHTRHEINELKWPSQSITIILISRVIYIWIINLKLIDESSFSVKGNPRLRFITKEKKESSTRVGSRILEQCLICSYV